MLNDLEVEGAVGGTGAGGFLEPASRRLRDDLHFPSDPHRGRHVPELLPPEFVSLIERVGGIRLWVDHVLLVDNWGDHAPVENSGVIALTAGRKVEIVMEMYENGVGAVARLLWSGPSTAKAVIPQARLFPGGGGLTGTYFNNADLSAQALMRTDAAVDFDWGAGSPDLSIGPDTFSVRWTGRVKPRYAQTYTFHTVSDDGVRLRVNGVLLIDNWADHAPTEDSGTIALAADQLYDVTMEFFEAGGGAVARLLWSSASQAKEVVPASRLFPPAGAAAKSGFRDVQEAIDAARPGDVVELDALTYFVPGGLVLKAGVTLRGVSPRATILDGQGAIAVITTQGRATIERLTITGGILGVDAGAGDVALRNVVVARNSGDGVLGRQGSRIDAVHVTAADNGGDGLRLLGGGRVRSSIACGNRGAGLSGPATATFTAFDAIEFEDPAALDYREKAGSIAVDAGDPADPFEREPAPNGGRANLGAFGDTAEAASSGVESDGRCGALGLEVLLALLLVAALRCNLFRPAA